MLCSLSGLCFCINDVFSSKINKSLCNSAWWSLQQISGAYSVVFLTRFIIFSIPQIQHGLIDNTQRFCFRPWHWVILAGSEGLKNVHSFLMSQFEHFHTSWAWIFWWSLRTQGTHQAQLYNPAASPAQPGCLGMEEPIIREHFGECYSLAFSLRVKIPRFLLDKGLLLAQHGEPQVKVLWCKHGKECDHGETLTIW